MILFNTQNLSQSTNLTHFNILVRRQRLTVLFWFFAFIFVSLFSWLYQQLDFAGSSEHGIPIPDIVNISNTFSNLLLTGGISQEANQFFGLSALYGWAWLLHPSLCFAINLTLMLWATKIYYGYFIKKLGAPAWSIIGVLGNPYLALAMAGPNKEIPLILLTLLYFRAITVRRPRWMLVAAVISIAAFSIRDGYGAFLFGSLILVILFNSRPKLIALVTCLACVTLSSFFGLLESVIPILQRNVEGFHSFDRDNLAVGAFAALLGLDPLSVGGGSILFFARATYNILTLSIFPVFQTTSGIYWLGVSYWLFGLLILVSMTCCVALFLFGKLKRSPWNIAAALTIGTWLMISISLFVQPRYLMPVLPLAVAVMACGSTRIRSYSLQGVFFLTGIAIFAYWALDRIPPPTAADSFDTPAYIILK